MCRVCAVFFWMTAQIVFFSPHAAAQGRWELRAGLAGFPAGVSLAEGFPFAVYDVMEISPYGYFREDRYADRRGDLVTAGTFTFDAFFRLSPRSAIGIGVGLDPLWGRVRDGYSGNVRGGQHAFGLSCWPAYRLTWNPDDAVRAYTSTALGVGFYHGVRALGAWSSIPVVQFVPLGLSIGRRPLSFFLELSAGTLTMGGRMGFAWCFQ